MKKLYLSLFLLISVFQIANAQKAEDFESKTKGLKKYSGYFNFYWNDKTGQVFLEINHFNDEFLYVSSMPAGVGSNDLGMDRGQIGDSRIKETNVGGRHHYA